MLFYLFKENMSNALNILNILKPREIPGAYRYWTGATVPRKDKKFYEVMKLRDEIKGRSI